MSALIYLKGPGSRPFIGNRTLSGGQNRRKWGKKIKPSLSAPISVRAFLWAFEALIKKKGNCKDGLSKGKVVKDKNTHDPDPNRFPKGEISSPGGPRRPGQRALPVRSERGGHARPDPILTIIKKGEAKKDQNKSKIFQGTRQTARGQKRSFFPPAGGPQDKWKKFFIQYAMGGHPETGGNLSKGN